MVLERKPIAIFLSFLGKLGDFRSLYRKDRVHNYTSYKSGEDYAFDQIQDGSQAYMTAYGLGIKRGDLIIVLHEGERVQYKIEQIDYYSTPADLWVALLVRNQ